jgi:hypothetical protein
MQQLQDAVHGVADALVHVRHAAVQRIPPGPLLGDAVAVSAVVVEVFVTGPTTRSPSMRGFTVVVRRADERRITAELPLPRVVRHQDERRRGGRQGRPASVWRYCLR